MYFYSGKNEECCGCKACGDICPKDAIEYNFDKGFWYPYKNMKKCIDCKKCEEVCPIDFKEKILIEDNEQVYACFVNDKNILFQSSSGGMFTLLANYILENNGIVFGCKYSENMIVIHAEANKYEQLIPLSGTKYVQSDTAGIYKIVKKRLDEGQKILFSGTPCQIEALKNYLDKEYFNLITVDIVCHGVPSPQIFIDYIKLIEKKKNLKIKDFQFRNKTIGWNTPMRIIKYYNGLVNKNKLVKDPFNYLFQNLDLIERPSCYECKYAGAKRISDITIGDYWGVEKNTPEMFNNNNGVSIILLNTKKGNDFFLNIPKNRYTIKQISLKSAQEKNIPLRNNIRKNEKRNEFFKNYDRKGIEYCIKHYSETNKIKRIIKKILRKIKI